MVECNFGKVEMEVQSSQRAPTILEAAGRTATGSQDVHRCIGKYRTDDVGRILPNDPLTVLQVSAAYRTCKSNLLITFMESSPRGLARGF